MILSYTRMIDYYVRASTLARAVYRELTLEEFGVWLERGKREARIGEVSSEELEEYHRFLKEDMKMTPHHRAHRRKVINDFMQFAYDQGWTTTLRQAADKGRQGNE